MFKPPIGLHGLKYLSEAGGISLVPRSINVNVVIDSSCS